MCFLFGLLHQAVPATTGQGAALQNVVGSKNSWHLKSLTSLYDRCVGLLGPTVGLLPSKFRDTVDGSENQLRLEVHPIIYRVLAPSQVVGNGISEPSTVTSIVYR